MLKPKITVGLGAVDDYIPFVKAGADEVYCGFISEELLISFGMMPAVNRREVYYYPVQIGSLNELRILSKMRDTYQVPVTITLNNICYHPKQLPLLIRMIRTCMSLGFKRFIIGDWHLLQIIQQDESLHDVEIHLSGEAGELNSYTLELLKNVKRIILHRQMDLSSLDTLIDDRFNYEAFILNEKCQFFGAYCMSFHCDEMRPLCRINYQMEQSLKEDSFEYVDGMIGQSGCGLCALWRLVHLGVEYFKIVSRGNYAQDTINDIKTLKKAINLLTQANSEEMYKRILKEKLFKNGCSHNCYYGIF